MVSSTFLAIKAAGILRIRLAEVAELGSRVPSSRDLLRSAPAEEAVQWQARQAHEDITWLSDKQNAGPMEDALQMLLEANNALLAFCEGI